MKHIEQIKKAVVKKRVKHPVHEAVWELEVSIHGLIMAWNDLPDDLRFDERLKGIGDVVKDIGG